MRLAFTATLVAGGAALLDKKGVHKHTIEELMEADPEAIRGQAEAVPKEHQEFTDSAQKMFAEHPKKAEADMAKVNSMMKEMDEKRQEVEKKAPKKEDVASMVKAATESHKTREEKEKTMSKDEALGMLQGKMDESARQQVAMLMKTQSTEQISEKVKGLLIKSVQTLNDMFSTTDKMRNEHVMTCHNDIWMKYKTVKGLYDNIKSIVSMYVKAATNVREANDAQNDIFMNEWIPEWGNYMAMWQRHMNEMREMWHDWWAKKEDVLLFRFILWQIEPRCVDGKMKTAFMQQGLSKAERCRESCLQDTRTVNKVLMNVFADPEVSKLAKYELSARGNEKMDTTIRHLKEAEFEVSHYKYSFLQTSSSSRHPELNKPQTEGLRIDREPGCGCEGSSMDCDGVMVLVGQELECKKEILRATVVDIMARLEEHYKERARQYQTLRSIHMTYMNHEYLKNDNMNEMMTLYPMYLADNQKYMEAVYDLHVYRVKCIIILQDIDQNQYCGIAFIRRFMRDLALHHLKIKHSDVKDCDLASEYSVAGDCEDENGNKKECFAGEKLPPAEDFTYRQKYERAILQPAYNTTEVFEKLGSKDITLQCPDAQRVLELPCSYWLCPIDCTVSPYGEFSTCTKKCDTGEMIRSRSVLQYNVNGGAICPDLSDKQPCGTDPCDVDCVLHEREFPEGHAGGCLQACLNTPPQAIVPMGPDEVNIPSFCDSGYRCRVVRRGIEEAAIGEGECAEKNHESRYKELACAVDQSRMCTGDEVCGEVMDLVIAYECSIATGRLGCYYIASFVTMLLRRMPSATYDLTTMKVGLVWYGNGRSKRDPNNRWRFNIAPAVRIPFNVEKETDADALFLSLNVGEKLIPAVFRNTFQLWAKDGNKSGFRIGFNNAAQALQAAMSIHNDEGRGGETAKKILFITTGARSECTEWSSLAVGAQVEGYVIDVVLFAKSQEDLTNPELFKDIALGVTYPPKVHFMKVGTMDDISDKAGRGGHVSTTLPIICPGAFSPVTLQNSLCKKKVQLLHRGKSCSNWNQPLAEMAISLEECRAKAMDEKAKSFIHTESEHLRLSDVHVGSDAGESPFGIMATDIEAQPGSMTLGPNCFIHPKDSLDDPVDEKGLPKDDTCKAVPDFAKDAPEDYIGWKKAMPAPGGGDTTNQYKALESEAECPKTEGGLEESAFFKAMFPADWKGDQFVKDF